MNEPVSQQGKGAWLYRIGAPVIMIAIAVFALSFMNRTQTLAATSAEFGKSVLTFRIYLSDGAVFVSYQEQAVGSGPTGKSFRVGAATEIGVVSAKIDVNQATEIATYHVGKHRLIYDHKSHALAQTEVLK